MSNNLLAELDRSLLAAHTRLKDLPAESRDAFSIPKGLVRAVCQVKDLEIRKSQNQNTMVAIKVLVHLDSIDTRTDDHAGSSFSLYHVFATGGKKTLEDKLRDCYNELKLMGFATEITASKSPGTAFDAIIKRVKRNPPVYFLLSTSSTKLKENGDPWITVLGPCSEKALDGEEGVDPEPADEPSDSVDETPKPKTKTTKTKTTKTKTKSSGINVGSRVHWTVGGQVFPGTIQSDDGDKWMVLFDDGDEVSVDKTDEELVPID